MPEPQISLKVALLEPLNANPFFETTATPWSPYGATFTRSTTQAYQGAASGLLTPDGVTSGPAVGSELVPTTPNLTHRVQAWVRANVAGRLQIGLNWYDPATVHLGESVASVDLTAGVWTQIEHTADSPSSAGYGQMKIVLPGLVPVWHLVYIDVAMLLASWTDLAGRLHYGDGGGPLTIDIGRQTESQDIEPTRIAAVLKNGDGWLTPRNPASPYYGTWEQGRQVRITETVGGEEIDLATGLLEIPDVQVNSPNVDQPCSISAVDRLGRLAGAPSFDGTLAEHIRTYGGPLVEWFPLSEPATAGEYLSTTSGTVTRRVVHGFGGAVPIAAEPEELITAASMAGPPGDDQSYARWNPVGDTAGLSSFAEATLLAAFEQPVTVAAGDVIALSAWVNLSAYEMAAGSEEPGGWIVSLYSAQTSATLRIIRRTLSVPGPDLFMQGGQVYVPGDTTRTMDTGQVWPRDQWRLVTTRLHTGTGVHELWVGHDATASQATGVTPGVQTFDHLDIGLGWSGAIGNIQIRVGPAATTMSRTMHLEQYAHGCRGLHRQTVAERIATLAAFAGLAPTDLDLPAEASTPMQVAELGGKTPAQAMQEAATTGQDILMTTPQGRITLVPRVRRYNQPVTLAIPFGWLMRGGIRYRPDRPVTDTVATRTGGGTARRVSGPQRARYGVLARTVALDTDVDADPANWAAWTLAAFGQPRTRCPLLRINLLNRTIAARKALLRLRVGDRIQLTGMPVGSPDDVPHLIVQGIRHVIGPHRRRLLEFNTSPLLGPVPGAPPACPVVGDFVGNAALIAY
ncbi:hypothetical protein AB0A95_30835 [Micromonospora sp. NPDC049230]|uniref:hypothetical protein n=1 Tax=Micromonospora sp. NPDC049230 TaxID=3155502 RepID=UPI00340EF98A